MPAKRNFPVDQHSNTLLCTVLCIRALTMSVLYEYSNIVGEVAALIHLHACARMRDLWGMHKAKQNAEKSILILYSRVHLKYEY